MSDDELETRWSEQRRQIAELTGALQLDVAAACEDHNPVQHRDRRRPWCRACGRTGDGVTIGEPRDEARCAERGPSNYPYRCVRPDGHDGQHGYAGVFW